MDEEEFLTQEQIDELLNIKYVFDYYVYFEKEDGTILAVSNEVYNHYECSVKVEFEEVERFFNNTDQHFNFKVVFDADGKPSFINRLATNTVKTNIVETIRLTDKECVLTVVWTKSGWEFIMADSFLQHPRSKSVNYKLSFYVTREDDINRLIRVIEIQLKNIVGNGVVKIPFITEQELKVDEISMFTLPFFESYGMKINDNN